MQFEWDENKRLSNIQNYGVDFEGIPTLFDGDTITPEDTRFDYGEQRFITIGLLIGRVLVVVHTEESDRIRIISARKATKHEERLYFQNL